MDWHLWLSLCHEYASHYPASTADFQIAVPPSSDPSDFDIAAEMLSVGIRPCEVQSFLLFAANSPLFFVPISLYTNT
jgi:hypothetical protein